MIVVYCPACVQNYRMLTDDSLVGTASEFWPDKYVCPVCRGLCVGVHEGMAYGSVPTRDIEPMELYAAMHGLGLPGEMVCDGETVRSLLKEGVEKVAGFDVPGTTRFIVDYLVLKDGSRVYFGASPHGAIIYRITRKHNYTAKQLEGIDG